MMPRRKPKHIYSVDSVAKLMENFTHEEACEWLHEFATTPSVAKATNQCGKCGLHFSSTVVGQQVLLRSPGVMWTEVNGEWQQKIVASTYSHMVCPDCKEYHSGPYGDVPITKLPDPRRPWYRRLFGD